MQSNAGSAPAGTRSSWRRRIDLSDPDVTTDELWEVRDFVVHQPSRTVPVTGVVATSAPLAEVVVTATVDTPATFTTLRDIAREAVLQVWPTIEADEIVWVWSQAKHPRPRSHYIESYSAFGRLNL